MIFLSRWALAVSISLMGAAITPSWAWWPEGHTIITRAAVDSLPEELPAWFRAGADQMAHSSWDPDIHRERSLGLMTEVETPRHFINPELLAGRPLPRSRAEFLALCRQLEVDPAAVGELPYALAEWTQRLTMNFAEARRFPGNRFIENKTLVTAGILSHYSGDATMPLHTTIHYNGRALPDGSSPRTGIHARVDSLIERLNPSPSELRVEVALAPQADLWSLIESELVASTSLVDRTYELEEQMPPERGEWSASPQVKAFGLERTRAATRFTAALFALAWRESQHIQLPTWLERRD